MAAVRRCPTCGYSGDEEFCPFDGTALAVLKARVPHVEDSDEDTNARPSGDESPTLRDPNFGEWEVPKGIHHAKNLIGETIGERYVIQSILGQGGMGTVYAAHQTSVERSVSRFSIENFQRMITSFDAFIRKLWRPQNCLTPIAFPSLTSGKQVICSTSSWSIYEVGH